MRTPYLGKSKIWWHLNIRCAVGTLLRDEFGSVNEPPARACSNEVIVDALHCFFIHLKQV
jgi:hypothetical protein